ncbi:MAG: transporter substrate-binding domain-containing protein [Oscillospiraceae bacterium]|nr:transporter substrate-binding domain-containing protein [Oscillospiraceae bacterium]MDD7354233.1 transporter substrate-binding domain-containing protein [Oscillospiraceae bacterium]MDY3938276.1 transporter substrate-binding domain-containing protein [Oscillospiraceae bacterium]
MKKLTKVAAILMALALIVTAFAACSGDKNTDPSKADSSNADTSNSADANAVKYTARKDDGKLIMATNATFPPYEYKDGDKIVGIDAEVAEKIAEKLGKELVIEDVEFGSIIAGVQTGKFDIGMAGMTVTPEREKSVNFTKSYAKGVQAVIVTEDSPIKSLDDLKGDGSMKFGVQQDTTGDIYASDTAENGGYGEENVIRFKAATDTVQALKSGKVDAVIIDNEPAKSFVASTSGLKILDGAWVDEDYAVCVAKENTELLNQVNKALDELKADGTLQQIVDKYIPAN